MTRRRCAALVALMVVGLGTGTGARDRDAVEFVARRARLSDDPHTVIVSGAYRCGPLDLEVAGGGGTIDLTMTQSPPDGPVAGFGFVPITTCDGKRQTYQSEVTAFGEAGFLRGAAELDASGLVCGDPGGGTICVQVLISDQRIRIRRPATLQ